MPTEIRRNTSITCSGWTGWAANRFPPTTKAWKPVGSNLRRCRTYPTATLVGGGRASVDQAAFFNAVLVRYPDLLDTYLTPGGLCHPADNFGAVFAVAEHVGATGADFLLALAVAYEVQCRFSAAVPV